MEWAGKLQMGVRLSSDSGNNSVYRSIILLTDAFLNSAFTTVHRGLRLAPTPCR